MSVVPTKQASRLRKEAIALIAIVVSTLTLSNFSLLSANAAPVTCNGLNATIVSSASQIQGTNGSDVIVVQGNIGSSVSGLAGNDVICGSAGPDILNGGAGVDKIFGQAGNDSLIGGVGNDRLIGGAGNDSLIGGAGNDSLNGGAGTNTFQGGAGVDAVNASTGTNFCAVDNADSVIGSCSLDTQGPAIANTSVVAEGTSLTFQWVVSDLSGVDSSWLKIGGPSGWVTTWCGFSVMGQATSTANGVSTYSADCQVPASAVNAVYTAYFDGVDVFGSPSKQSTLDFQIDSGVSDASAPVSPDVSVVGDDPSTSQPITIDVSTTETSGTVVDAVNASTGTNFCALANADPIIGTCTLDDQGPVIANTSVVAAGTLLTFTWSISDISGVDSSWLKIGGPSGWVTTWCGFVINGQLISNENGISRYSANCQVPTTAVNAVYTAYFDGVDVFGMPSKQTTLDFQIAAGVSDASAPVSSNVSVVGGNPSSRQPITITWNSTDTSGVEYAIVWVSIKDGGFANNSGLGYFDYETATRISGTPQDGVFQQVITPNANTVPGEYTIWISARDIYGNKDFSTTSVVFSTP